MANNICVSRRTDWNPPRTILNGRLFKAGNSDWATDTSEFHGALLHGHRTYESKNIPRIGSARVDDLHYDERM